MNKVILSTESELSEVAPVKLFCGTYTMAANHDGNVHTLRNTWGKRCDGWAAFSTKDDHSLPAMDIPHEGEESYDNMWQKSRAIWRYIGVHYSEDFDWFLLGGDDMYYIVENLRYYLGNSSTIKLDGISIVIVLTRVRPQDPRRCSWLHRKRRECSSDDALHRLARKPSTLVQILL